MGPMNPPRQPAPWWFSARVHVRREQHRVPGGVYFVRVNEVARRLERAARRVLADRIDVDDPGMLQVGTHLRFQQEPPLAGDVLGEPLDDLLGRHFPPQLDVPSQMHAVEPPPCEDPRGAAGCSPPATAPAPGPAPAPAPPAGESVPAPLPCRSSPSASSVHEESTRLARAGRR